MTFGDQATLWPIHPKPYRDEVLSSWISRVGAGLGLSLHDLLKAGLPKPEGADIDIDRITDLAFFEALARGTGASLEATLRTGFAADEGSVYSRTVLRGLEWIIPLGALPHTRKHTGIPFCPGCLSNDDDPYYRKSWRYAFHPVCPHHGLLTDNCPFCGRPYVYQDFDGAQDTVINSGTIHLCRGCGHPFKASSISGVDDRLLASMLDIQARILGGLEKGWIEVANRGQVHICNYLRGLRDIARIFQRGEKSILPMEWVYRESGATFAPLDYLGKDRIGMIESRPASSRAKIIYLADWLVGEWPSRLVALMKALDLSPGALRLPLKRWAFWTIDPEIEALSKDRLGPVEQEIASATDLLRRRRKLAPTSPEVAEFMRTGELLPMRPLKPLPSPQSRELIEEFWREMNERGKRPAKPREQSMDEPRTLYPLITIDPAKAAIEDDIREASEDIEGLYDREKREFR